MTLAAWLLVFALLFQTEGVLIFQSTVLLLALLAALWSAHLFYRRQMATRRLASMLGLLALLMASGAAAGAISQLGLALRMPLIDPLLAQADRFLGFHAPAVVSEVVAWPHTVDLLGFAYLSSFPLLFGTALLLAARGEDERAWELVFIFAGAIIFASCCAVLLPARGAFPYFDLGAEVTSRLPLGSGVYHLPAMNYFRSSSEITLDLLHLQGVVTFPSFHTALACMTASAWRHCSRVFYPMLGWNALVIASTIPIGGHYGIDLLAGALLWAALASTGAWLARSKGSADRIIGTVGAGEPETVTEAPEGGITARKIMPVRFKRSET